MPRFRVTKLIAGPDGVFHPGQILDLSAETGAAYVVADAAIALDMPALQDSSPLVERATDEAEEHAVGAPQRRGRSRG